MFVSRFVSAFRRRRPPPTGILPMESPSERYWRDRRRKVFRRALPWIIVLLVALVALPFTL